MRRIGRLKKLVVTVTLLGLLVALGISVDMIAPNSVVAAPSCGPAPVPPPVPHCSSFFQCIQQWIAWSRAMGQWDRALNKWITCERVSLSAHR